MGKDRYFYQVDQDPETREATVSASCPAGDYTVRVSLSSAANEELASASTGFTVAEPTTGADAGTHAAANPGTYAAADTRTYPGPAGPADRG